MKITIPLSAITICLLAFVMALVLVLELNWIWGLAAVFLYFFIELVQFLFTPQK